MKRPQSAKPGHKGHWGNSSMEDMNDQQQKPPKKQVKIVKPDFTHDFGRILPRKIQQDKQRLYSQALQLKQNMNEMVQENVRLKTKISILQREKQKMNKMMETAPEGLGSKGSRLNVYQTRTYEKDNMIVRNLKKIVKEAKEDNEIIKAENHKIKKVTKYTKINQLQIQRKTIIDENKRLSAMLEEYSSQFVNQEEVERQNQQLKKYLEQQIEQRNQLEQQREKYEQIIESLEEKIKSQTDKWQAKQKKIIRDFNVEKRRTNQLQRKNQDLMRQLKSIRQNQQFIQQKQKNTKAAIRVSNIQRNSKQGRFNTQQSDNAQVDRKINQVKNHNQQLLKQVQELKERLRKVQSQKMALENSISKKSFVVHQEEKEQNLKENEQINNQQNNDDYEEQFDEQNTKQIEELNNKQEDQIQKYKKDFQENQEQEELFKQQDKKQEKTKKNKSNAKEKKQKKTASVGIYKPNKKILAQIKQLLTYRMKSQRYPFTDIKSDIQSAQTSTFTYLDLCNMFANEPFYLTAEYTKAFLSYCFEKEKNEGTDVIPNAVLVNKLRKVIDDFELMQENQEKEMIIRIAEMTSTYPRQLQVAFQNIKNGEQTVARKDLIEMFKKLELQDKYIDLIISQLSLCSDDLQHLNFHGFFQRFYIQDEGQDYLDNAIQEQGEESEQSRKHSSRVKKGKGNKSAMDGDVQV